jgi:Uma2 family endonuclease
MAQAESVATTAREYFLMPEGPPYHQLIEGVLYDSPSHSWQHQTVVGNICFDIGEFVASRDLGHVFTAPLDVILDEKNIFEPDILYFPNSRKELLGKRCIEGAPDFIVEIISDATAHLDNDLKGAIYARSGVKELWLIELAAKTIAIFDFAHSAEKPVEIHRPPDTFASAIFPGLTFSTAKFFEGV